MSEVIKPPAFVWTFPASVSYVQDGDTVVVHAMLHPNEGGVVHDLNVRVEGINAPELNTAAGISAREFAKSLLPVGMQVMLVARKREKFGRFLARIILPSGDDFSELMIMNGYAVAYLT